MIRRLIEYISDNFFNERERFVVWLAVLFGVGIGIYFALGFEPNKWITVAVFEALLLLLYLWRYSQGRILFLTAVFVMFFGFCDIQLQTLYKSKFIAAPAEDEITYLSGRIVSVGHNAKGKVRLLLTDVADFDNPRKGYFRITLPAKQTTLQQGQCVELVATVMKPSAPALPSGYQFDRKAFYEGISAVGYANSSVFETDCEQALSYSDKLKYAVNGMRQKIVNRINDNLAPDEAGITAAIVAGERGGISEEITENYRNSGLAHFLSISGLHMSMIAAMAFFAVRLLIALIPAVALRIDSKKVAAIFAAVMSLIYLLISGAEIPSQRAFITMLAVLIGILFGRQAISMRMVAFAAITVLVISPQALVSAGFQMSFAAVVVLIAFYETYALKLRKFFAGSGLIKILTAYFAGLMLTDLVASLATLPFAIYHFNQVAVYTTLGNLLAGPIIAFIIMPFVLLSLFLMPFGLEVWPLKIVGFGVGLVNTITDYVAHLPAAGYRVMAMPFWGLLMIVFGGLWICIWQRKWRRWGAIPLIIGALSIFWVQKPDALYDASGEVVAVKDNEDNMVVLPSRSNKWIKQIWLEKTVSLPPDKADKKNLQQIFKGGKTDKDWLDLECDEETCVYKKALRLDKGGGIEISGRQIDTKAHAGGAVYINGGKAKIKTVREDIGCRLWNFGDKCRKNQ